MEAKKTTEKKTKLLNITVLLLTLFLAYRFFVSPMDRKIKVIEASAQVISTDSKIHGTGTASKSWNESSTAFNVSAFLDKPKSGMFYYAYLKGNGDLKDMKLGKMELSGDVYTVNYTANKNIFGYKDLYVTLQTESDANSGKVGESVFTGSFNK